MNPLIIAGPTGVGKSDLALRIALARGGEIVNYDSVQIYRGFDIGSAKPSAELRRLVPHHLFDLIDADDNFNADGYGKLARQTCHDITARGHLPILVGGTFFYLRAFLSGLPEMPGRNDEIRRRIRAIAEKHRGQARLHRWLSKIDPHSGRKIAPADRHRVERALEVWLASGHPISSGERPSAESSTGEAPATKIALFLDKPVLVDMLDRRVNEMYRAGLLEETRALLARYPRAARPFGSIGYREAASVVAGEITLETAINETKRRTRAYAKRQMTWLRSERNVQWLDAAGREKTFEAAMRLVEGES